MASHRAIAATSRAILGLVEEHCPRAALINPDFKLYHPLHFATPMSEGFSLCLYRLAVNTGLRNRPPRRTPEGRCYQPSLPVDLHYLLTPWAADPERQQRLLGWSARFFEDMAVLPAGVLNRHLRETETFRAGESVEIASDPLPLGDHLNLWDKLKPQLQPSLTYVARVVLIDSEVEITEAGPVQTRQFDMGALVS